MSKRAVIDLGTNTFHLLIVAIEQSDFKVLYKERKYVYLGESGVHKISAQAYARGIAALTYFKEILSGFDDIESIDAFGTSALRNASNNDEFVKDVFAQTGITIQIISGDQEAQYIANGVGLLYTKPKHHLVMDIGGGSVEFILGKNDVIWKKSFKIGISVLHDLFHNQEPIGDAILSELYTYLSEELTELKTQLEPISSIDLIGAAGTFEVLARQLKTTEPKLYTITTDEIIALFEATRVMNFEERLAYKLIPDTRAKYIVVGLAIIVHVLGLASFDEVLVSPYALKEGVIAKYLA